MKSNSERWCEACGKEFVKRLKCKIDKKYDACEHSYDCLDCGASIFSVCCSCLDCIFLGINWEKNNNLSFFRRVVRCVREIF